MITLVQLWLPIVLAASFVFVASSIVHMVLQWHKSDYRGCANEEEVRAALGKSLSAPGIYLVPYCNDMKQMASPEMQAKFREGPVAKVILRAGMSPSMGKPLGQWFAFCVLVSLFCAGIASHGLPAGAATINVFSTIGMAALMGYGFYTIPHGIWWGQPWSAVLKDLADGLLYALVTAGTFAWLWPR
ncbi:MAG: hypothetical protein ABI846_04650 [Rudaea sp.]